jgi:hypothetical protein
MTLTLEWISGGNRKEHVVTKQVGESFTAFYERAQGEFEAAQTEFPPD